MSYDDMRKVMRETDEYMHKTAERDDTKTESDTCAFEQNAEQVNSPRDETPVFSIFVAIAISIGVFALVFGGFGGENVFAGSLFQKVFFTIFVVGTPVFYLKDSLSSPDMKRSVIVAITLSLCIFIFVFGGVTSRYSRYSSPPSETATSIQRAEVPVGAYYMNDGGSDGMPREDIVRILAARDRRAETESGRGSGSWMWFMLPLFFLR